MSLTRLTLLPLSAALLLCASCSSGGPDAQEDRSEAPAGDYEPPNIGPSAAPGVAFRYDYDFQLPDKKISSVQEQHAKACEQLGLARCRITGMSYGVNDDGTVTAGLALKLEPTIARAFGKQASNLVETNDGRLIHLTLAGDDVGARIDAAQQRRIEIEKRISELEAQLAKLAPKDEARTALNQQIQSLKDELDSKTQSIASGQEELANTPMAFQYYGRGGVPGFHGNPLREAWVVFVGLMISLVRFALLALAVLVPLALLVVFGVLLWRSRPARAARRWLFNDDVSADE